MRINASYTECSVCSLMRIVCNARMRMYAPQRMQQYVFGCVRIHVDALECNLLKKLHVFVKETTLIPLRAALVDPG